MHWYNIAKEDLDENEWEKEKEALLKRFEENKKIYLALLLLEKRDKEVLDALIKAQESPYRNYMFDILDQDHYYSSRLKDKFPKEIYEYWRKEANKYTSLKQRESYRSAADVILDIWRLAKEKGMTNAFNSDLSDYVERNKAKRLLKDELRASGLLK